MKAKTEIDLERKQERRRDELRCKEGVKKTHREKKGKPKKD